MPVKALTPAPSGSIPVVPVVGASQQLRRFPSARPPLGPMVPISLAGQVWYNMPVRLQHAARDGQPLPILPTSRQRWMAQTRLGKVPPPVRHATCILDTLTMPHDERLPSRMYWTRAVSFAGLHRLLKAVAEASDGLRAREINALVLNGRLTLTPRRSPPKPTTLYHYRNTLIRLGALARDGLRLRANLDDPNVVALLDEPAPADGDQSLSDAAREHFAALVLGNDDCRTLFFDLFMPSGRPCGSVVDFRERGAPVTWMRRPGAGAPAIVFRNHATRRMIEHTSRASISAVLYGLRYWARDELTLVDEYCERTMDSTTMFPIAPPPSSPADRHAAILHAVRFLLSLRPRHAQGEWTMLSVSDLIVQYCETHRQPRGVLFRAIDWLQREWPGHTSLVPTPLGLATLAASSPQQENLALRRYYKPTSGPYVSHIRFHQGVTADAADARHHHA